MGVVPDLAGIATGATWYPTILGSIVLFINAVVLALVAVIIKSAVGSKTDPLAQSLSKLSDTLALLGAKVAEVKTTVELLSKDVGTLQSDTKDIYKDTHVRLEQAITDLDKRFDYHTKTLDKMFDLSMRQITSLDKDTKVLAQDHQRMQKQLIELKAEIDVVKMAVKQIKPE